MKFRRTDTPSAAAAKAGFSPATAYRLEAAGLLERGLVPEYFPATGTNGQGETNARVHPHPLYLALGTDDAGRQAAYP